MLIQRTLRLSSSQLFVLLPISAGLLPLLGVLSELNETEIDFLVATRFGVVAFMFVATVQVEEPLEPLYELQVVLVLALRKLFNFDVLLDVALLEGLLQNLEVLDELPLVACSPVHLADLDLARKHRIEYLAVDGSGAQLFDLREVEIEEAVGPVEKVGLRDEEGTLHHTYALVCHLS